jgi:hypothetical protein
MDFVKRAFADTRTSALSVGLATVVISHTSIILDLAPKSWNSYQQKNHAQINLVAAGLILYGSGLV